MSFPFIHEYFSTSSLIYHEAHYTFAYKFLWKVSFSPYHASWVVLCSCLFCVYVPLILSSYV